jgi:hypothetical protein
MEDVWKRLRPTDDNARIRGRTRTKRTRTRRTGTRRWRRRRRRRVSFEEINRSRIRCSSVTLVQFTSYSMFS